MSGSGTERSLTGCVARWLAAQPRPGRDLTSAQAGEGQDCLGVITGHPAAAVPLLLDALRDGDFPDRNACYRLLVELGPEAGPALRAESGRRGPETDLWLAGALRHRGDPRGISLAVDLMDDPAAPVRDLAALAVGLAAIEDDVDVSEEALITRLTDALASDRVIDGTPFRVGDAALICLTRLGVPVPLVPDPPELHNDQHFAFPPPSPPFPLAPETALSGLDPDAVAGLQAALRGAQP